MGIEIDSEKSFCQFLHVSFKSSFKILTQTNMFHLSLLVGRIGFQGGRTEEHSVQFLYITTWMIGSFSVQPDSRGWDYIKMYTLFSVALFLFSLLVFLFNMQTEWRQRIYFWTGINVQKKFTFEFVHDQMKYFVGNGQFLTVRQLSLLVLIGANSKCNRPTTNIELAQKI